MENTWILVANGSRAHLLETLKPRHMLHDDDLSEVACYEHPESREKMDQLAADGYGHNTHPAGAGGAGIGGHGDFVERSEVRQNEKNHFAHELAEMIHKAHQANRFQRLVLVMSPELYGLFKPLLSDAVQQLVLMHINKDYSGLPKHELRVQLVPHLNLD